MRLLLTLCLRSLIGIVTAWLPATNAQPSDAPPLQILVGVPPGGTSDLIARVIAERLKDDLARPVIVENRPGATGRIAVNALRNAKPDGSTLLLVPITVPVIVPLVFNELNYDASKDLVPVSQIATYEFALVVAADHPSRNVREFVAWTKSNRSQVTFGTIAIGSLSHIVGTMFAKATSIELVHVPYKGVAPLETDLMRGQISAGVAIVSDVVALHRAGRIRILATSGTRRSSGLADVPTFIEQGYPSLEAIGWHGVYVPAGTPHGVVDRLSAAIVATLQQPSVRQTFLAQGLNVTGTTPEALTAIMRIDSDHWRRVIQSSGFTLE